MKTFPTTLAEVRSMAADYFAAEAAAVEICCLFQPSPDQSPLTVYVNRAGEVYTASRCD